MNRIITKISLRQSARSTTRARKITGATVAATALLGAGVLAGSLLTGGAATAGPAAESKSTASQSTASKPISEAAVPNLGKAKLRIQEYYGERKVNGVPQPSPTSPYAREVARIQKVLKVYLAAKAKPVGGKKPAIVFDVDDTSLLTYDYQAGRDFGYEKKSNAEYINAQKSIAVFGMPAIVNWAQSAGYTVFYITGRPEDQRAATEGNLAKVGYAAKADKTHLFLKNKENPPPYLPCGADCTSVEYKSGTRAHLESLGYRIVATIGDQQSDLTGGHADRGVKIPNPMYYLP